MSVRIRHLPRMGERRKLPRKARSLGEEPSTLKDFLGKISMRTQLMFARIGISMAGGLLAAVLMTGGQIDAANDNVPEGGEVLGRGPIHEAFAQPLEEGLAQAGPVAPKAPP